MDPWFGPGGNGALAQKVVMWKEGDEGLFVAKASKNDTKAVHIWKPVEEAKRVLEAINDAYQEIRLKAEVKKSDTGIRQATSYFEKVIEHQQYTLRRQGKEAATTAATPGVLEMGHLTGQMLKLWEVLKRRREVGVERAEEIPWSEGAATEPSTCTGSE